MNKITKKWISIFLLVVNLILVSNFIVNAQQDSVIVNSVNAQCLIDSSLKLKVTDVASENASGNRINDRGESFF